jgi:hypothetical protein
MAPSDRATFDKATFAAAVGRLETTIGAAGTPLGDATRRILDAAIKAGGVPVRNITVATLLLFIFVFWLPEVVDLDDRKKQKAVAQQRRRVIKAIRVLQAALQSPADIEWAKRIERDVTPVPADDDATTIILSPGGSVLVRLVGRLAEVFDAVFQEPAGYTTNPDNETDSPFIRFVEQAFREFRVTRDGNQPYQRRTIADALYNYRKRQRNLKDEELIALVNFSS